MEHTSLNFKVKALKEKINKLKEHNNELSSCTTNEITNVKKYINKMKYLIKSMKLRNYYEMDYLESKYTNIIKIKMKKFKI
jgi:hypothetical protein